MLAEVHHNRNIFHGKEVSPYMGALISRNADLRSGQGSEEITKRIEELHAVGQKRGRKNRIRSVVGIGVIFLFSLIFVYFFTNMAIEVFDITGQVDQKLNSIVNASLINREIDNSRCQDKCCMTSLDKMTSGNYPEYNEDFGCQEGYRKSSLKCATSLSWCEPILVSKKKKDCAGESSLFSLRNNKNSSKDSVCCEGLSAINSNMDDIYYCSYCGDEICKTPEDDQNCPVDCKILDTSGWGTFEHVEYMFTFLYPESWSLKDDVLVNDDVTIKVNKGLSPAEDIEVTEHTINEDTGPYTMLVYKKDGREIAREYKFLQISKKISGGFGQVENVFSVVIEGKITDQIISDVNNIISTFSWKNEIKEAIKTNEEWLNP